MPTGSRAQSSMHEYSTVSKQTASQERKILNALRVTYPRHMCVSCNPQKIDCDVQALQTLRETYGGKNMIHTKRRARHSPKAKDYFLLAGLKPSIHGHGGARKICFAINPWLQLACCIHDINQEGVFVTLRRHFATATAAAVFRTPSVQAAFW
jgi:hypothetical protein